MSDADIPRSLETKIESGILSVRFDGGHWIAAAHGAKKVVEVQDRGGEPRAGSLTYLNTWGLTVPMEFVLKAPKRLG